MSDKKPTAKKYKEAEVAKTKKNFKIKKNIYNGEYGSI